MWSQFFTWTTLMPASAPSFVLLCIVGSLCNKGPCQPVFVLWGQLTAMLFSIIQNGHPGSRNAPWSSHSKHIATDSVDFGVAPEVTFIILFLQKYLKKGCRSKTSKNYQIHLRRPLRALSWSKIGLLCLSIQHGFETLLCVSNLLFLRWICKYISGRKNKDKFFCLVWTFRSEPNG